MPPNESAFVVQRKVNRALEALAESYDLAANSDAPVATVRRATRDTLAELAEEYDAEYEVDAVALPSERLDDGDEPDEEPLDEGEGDEGDGEESGDDEE